MRFHDAVEHVGRVLTAPWADPAARTLSAQAATVDGLAQRSQIHERAEDTRA